MITISNLNNFAVEHGVSLATVENVRTVFNPDNVGLKAGMTYTMLEDEKGFSPVVEGKNTRHGVVTTYPAIFLTDAQGDERKVSVTSIVSTVMVLDDQNYSDEKWDGVAPAHAYHRYGGMTKSFGADKPKDYVDEDGKSTGYVGYPATKFTTGKTPVKYIVPRFVEGQRAPIYDAQCVVRTAYFAEDWKDFPGAGNNTSLPVATETVSAGTK